MINLNKELYIKYMKKILPCLLLLLMGLTNCAPKTTSDNLTLNNLNFSNYIAIGTDYTAGYANDGLNIESQKNSFPAMLAQQVRYIKNIPFNQPFLETGTDSYYGLKWVGADSICPDHFLQFRIDTVSGKNIRDWANISGSGYFQNLGIPYLKVADLNKHYLQLPNSVTPNMYFHRLLSNPLTSYMEYIKVQPQPSFFTLELGFNDVFSYVWKGGGQGSSNDISSQEDFEQNYSELVKQLTQNNAQGVLFTIPSVSDLPFVNMIGYEWVNNGDCKGNTLYEKEDSLGEVRKLLPGDFLLMHAYNNLKYGSNPLFGMHTDYPLDPKWVLDESEVQNAIDATRRFNAFIKKKAQENNLALFDFGQFIHEIKVGNVIIDGINLSSNYLEGGFYSLDGWSLTPRGNAIITNKVIEVTNSKYGSSIPFLNIEDYEGVRFPHRYGANCSNPNLPVMARGGKNSKQ
jgi:hypothetical protein